MIDILSKEERSERMSRIRSKNTDPERIIRKQLWRDGFRYRLDVDSLPGKPDIVFPSLKVAVLVHGCYWHGHTCQKGRIPTTNSLFWAEKFAANKARDRRNRARLKALGWVAVAVWECALSTKAKRRSTLARLEKRLRQARDEDKTCAAPAS